MGIGRVPMKSMSSGSPRRCRRKHPSCDPPYPKSKKNIHYLVLFVSGNEVDELQQVREAVEGNIRVAALQLDDHSLVRVVVADQVQPVEGDSIKGSVTEPKPAFSSRIGPDKKILSDFLDLGHTKKSVLVTRDVKIYFFS